MRSRFLTHLAHGCAFCLLLVSCRRSSSEDPRTHASVAVTAASLAPVVAPHPEWVGKRLHVWLTTCDAGAVEAKELIAAIAAHRGLIDGVGMACQAVQSDGALKTIDPGPPGRDRKALATSLQALGVATTILVANPGPGGFDGALGQRVVDSETSRARLAHDLIAVRLQEHHRGIELDLEAMPTKAATGYSKLVHELASAAGSGVEISVDVHPKTVDDPGWDGPGAHDYAAIAQAGAIVRLMTYDLSIGPVPPGPSTKASWIREVVAYARGKGVPAAQLEIGLPAYGYDFSIAKDAGNAGKIAPLALKYNEIMQLRARVKAEVIRDENGTPHFSYDAKEGRHEVWFDDAESLGRVIADLRDVAKDVRGIAIWGMGGADPQLLEALMHQGFR